MTGFWPRHASGNGIFFRIAIDSAAPFVRRTSWRSYNTFQTAASILKLRLDHIVYDLNRFKSFKMITP